jgi:hypothetical protein
MSLDHMDTYTKELKEQQQGSSQTSSSSVSEHLQVQPSVESAPDGSRSDSYLGGSQVVMTKNG